MSHAAGVEAAAAGSDNRAESRVSATTPMPRIVDYAHVVQTLTGQGLVSLYPGSGAFGFPPQAAAASVGWIGPPDPSIRAESRKLARAVVPPFEPTLAKLCTRVWTERLQAGGGVAWLLPKSHWAYELTFGSQEWLPELLRSIGAAPEELVGRHDGSAVEFRPGEEAAFSASVEGLLTRLFGSDFMLAWPGRPVVCTVHHHKQLWWTTTDRHLLQALDEMAPPG